MQRLANGRRQRPSTQPTLKGGTDRPRPATRLHATPSPPPVPQLSNIIPGKPAVTRPQDDSPASPLIPCLPVGPVLGKQLVDLGKRFRRLQNGSDVRGIAIDGVPNEPISLTPGIAFFIGKAFSQWLASRRDRSSDRPMRVSLGRDPRISGPMLEAALVAGLASGGAEVDLFGIATTPCMFYSIQATGRYDGAIMLTASHMPFNSNGLKFFTADGGLEKADITELLQRATQACGEAGVLVGEPLSETAHLLTSSLSVDPDKVQKARHTAYPRQQ